MSFISKKKKGGALMHVYVWEHIFSLCFSTAWWTLMKVGRDEVLVVSYRFKWFTARSAKRVDPRWGKIGHGGSPSKGFKELFLQT